MVLAVSLKDLFEKDLEEREVALFTSWMIVQAKNPDEVKERLFSSHGEVNIAAKGFRVLVEQYAYFMAPLIGGKPRFVLFKQTDEAFSERKKWLSLSSQGYDFQPPEEA